PYASAKTCRNSDHCSSSRARALSSSSSLGMVRLGWVGKSELVRDLDPELVPDLVPTWFSSRTGLNTIPACSGVLWPFLLLHARQQTTRFSTVAGPSGITWS